MCKSEVTLHTHLLSRRYGAGSLPDEVGSPPQEELIVFAPVAHFREYTRRSHGKLARTQQEHSRRTT
jgi:hypothetical protein